jgi:DNA-binding beta-propeller fold protein YncE
VDPDGTVTPVAFSHDPAFLAGSAQAVWAVDATTGSVSMIDPAAGTVERTVQVGTVMDAASDSSGLWLATARSGSLVHLESDGHRSQVAAFPVGVEQTYLASTGRLVWVANTQLVRAFDLSGGPRHTVVVNRDDSPIAGAPGALWIPDTITKTLVLVAPA